MKNLLRFTCTILAGMGMTVPLFISLTLTNRLSLEKDAYALVQQSFPASSFSASIEIVTLVFVVIWMLTERQTVRRFYTLLGATIFFTIALALLFLYVIPSETQTHGWTQLTDSAIKEKWEYAQLARGICMLVGFSLVIAHLLVRKTKSSRTRYPRKSY